MADKKDILEEILSNAETTTKGRAGKSTIIITSTVISKIEKSLKEHGGAFRLTFENAKTLLGNSGSTKVGSFVPAVNRKMKESKITAFRLGRETVGDVEYVKFYVSE